MVRLLCSALDNIFGNSFLVSCYFGFKGLPFSTFHATFSKQKKLCVQKYSVPKQMVFEKNENRAALVPKSSLSTRVSGSFHFLLERSLLLIVYIFS